MIEDRYAILMLDVDNIAIMDKNLNTAHTTSVIQKRYTSMSAAKKDCATLNAAHRILNHRPKE